MPKFNTRRAIAGLKREAKKLPGATMKQLPNAAMFVVPGGVAYRGYKAGRAISAAAKAKKPKNVVHGARKASDNFFDVYAPNGKPQKFAPSKRGKKRK